MPTLRFMYTGTVEYLDIAVTSTNDIVLSTQPVNVSIDGGATWHAAFWQGDEDTTRTCSLLLGAATTPPLPAPGSYDVRVQVIDNPEEPIVDAGYLIVLE